MSDQGQPTPPQDRAKAWDDLIANHRKRADELLDPNREFTEADIRISLANLHQGVAALAEQLKHKEQIPAGLPDAVPELTKTRVASLYEMQVFRYKSAADF